MPAVGGEGEAGEAVGQLGSGQTGVRGGRAETLGSFHRGDSSISVSVTGVVSSPMPHAKLILKSEHVLIPIQVMLSFISKLLTGSRLLSLIS